MKEHNNKSDNFNNERNWRTRRMPVKLVDFLVPDGDSASAISNVTPVISGSSNTTQNPIQPKNPCFAPTTEDFPAVGAKRSKKIKATPTEVADNSQPSSSKEAAPAQVTSDKYYKNQKVVHKWLQLVQPPEVQSQQVPPPLPQIVSHHASSSAPPIAPAVGAAVQQIQESQRHLPFTPPVSGGMIRPTQRMPVNRQFTPSENFIRPTQLISTNPAPPRMPRSVHSASVNPNVPGRPIMRTLSSFNYNVPRIATPNRKEIVELPDSGTIRRLHERRMRREQMSQLPDELMMLPDAPNSGIVEDASFVRELQQAVATNNPSTLQSQSQSQCNPLDIASQSTLNWNAVEFQPRRQSLNSNESQPRPQGIVQPIRRMNMITERRRRQRFNRTLKSDTLFELVTMPSEKLTMSESLGESQAAPSTISVPPRGSNMLSPIQNANSDASQSVFRLSSLPITGVGTGNNTLSTICDPSDCPMDQSGETFDLQQEDSPMEQSGETLDLQFEDSPTVQSGETLNPQQEDNRPLLDMDPSTQQTDASLFLAPRDPNYNKATQPRHMLFLKGNAERHNVQVDLKFMPPSVKKLYRLICGKYSDYAFVYTLSAQLSPDCVPMECYVYLKMALLISLTSIEPDELRAPISLCVICTDSSVANRLLNSIGQLAPRFIGPHEGGQQPSFSGLPTRFNWVQASPLMMAQQGVYYAGDWNRLSRDQTDELEKSIENSSLPIPQLQSAQPLEAAIWTYWQPENAANQATAFAKLCPIFGLPVHMDDPENEVMWDFVIRQHSRDSDKIPKDVFHIPIEDMRTLLELIQQREVFFTQPADHLLKKYYMISHAKEPTAFSSKTYVVLKQFAESLAKLAMRLDVLESDVVVAIFHSEHFVRSIFGAGEFPPPVVSNVNVISRVDPYMNIFSRWLFQYMDRYEDKVFEND